MFARRVIVFCILLTVGCSEDILHDLSEEDANRAIVTLARYDLKAQKYRDRTAWGIRIDEARANEAMTILESQRVIRRRREKAPEASANPFSDRDERQKAYERILASELEETLLDLPRVLQARVHLWSSQKEIPFAKSGERQTRAAVLLVVEEEDEKLSALARSLVSGATGVTSEGISVSITAAPLPKLDRISRVQTTAAFEIWNARSEHFGYLLVVLSLVGLVSLIRRSSKLSLRKTPDAHRNGRRAVA